MKKEYAENEKYRLHFSKRMAVIILLITLLGSASLFAWFYYGRKALITSGVSDPTAIFINAGNEENIHYLNLSDINVEDPENTERYRDYVFCIRGNNISSYKLQLAYTTNNQFSFEIYRATMLGTESPALVSVPNDAVAKVEWIINTGDDAGHTQDYYAASGSTPISGSFLNLNTSVLAESIALTDNSDVDSCYEKTYDQYNNRQKYAVPLYWQSNDSIAAVRDESGNLVDYFILRIKWNAGAVNDKETDIIYISAKNTSS